MTTLEGEENRKGKDRMGGGGAEVEGGYPVFIFSRGPGHLRAKAEGGVGGAEPEAGVNSVFWPRALTVFGSSSVQGNR